MDETAPDTSDHVALRSHNEEIVHQSDISIQPNSYNEYDRQLILCEYYGSWTKNYNASKGQTPHTFPGASLWPVEPILRCDNDAPWDAGIPLKPHLFIPPCIQKKPEMCQIVMQCKYSITLGNELTITFIFYFNSMVATRNSGELWAI